MRITTSIGINRRLWPGSLARRANGVLLGRFLLLLVLSQVLPSCRSAFTIAASEWAPAARPHRHICCTSVPSDSHVVRRGHLKSFGTLPGCLAARRLAARRPPHRPSRPPCPVQCTALSRCTATKAQGGCSCRVQRVSMSRRPHAPGDVRTASHAVVIFGSSTDVLMGHGASWVRLADPEYKCNRFRPPELNLQAHTLACMHA